MMQWDGNKHGQSLKVHIIYLKFRFCKKSLQKNETLNTFSLRKVSCKYFSNVTSYQIHILVPTMLSIYFHF